MNGEEFRKHINKIKTSGPGTQPREPDTIDGRAKRETKLLADEVKFAKEILLRHAKGVRETEMLREEIIKGTAAGEDWETLFFKAVKVVGLAIGDTGFLPIVEGAARRYKEKMSLQNGNNGDRPETDRAT